MSLAKFSKEEKQKRRLLLLEQHNLNEKYCISCPRFQRVRDDNKDAGSISPDKICGGCEIYDRLRTIGNAMLDTVNNEEKFRPKQKQRDITLEIYNKMRDEGKSDKEIREHFKIAPGSWYGVKKKIGAKMKVASDKICKGDNS